MSFSVLRADVPEERERWLQLWRAWPRREVYAHPCYVELFADEECSALALAVCAPGGAILFPLIRRPLSHLQWVPERLGHLCDLVSPYGYGGPYTWGDLTEADQKGFWQEAALWACQDGAVSEFVRFSLGEQDTAPYPGTVEPVAENVVRALNGNLADLEAGYRRKVRKNVRRALRDNLEAIVDPTGAYLADFLRIYYATMDRRQADAGYYFPERFFRLVNEALPESRIWFHVRHGGRIVSSELVLVSACRAYSFLGGTLPEEFEHRPNDLLKHTIMQWACERGLEAFVLGGGYTPNDGIYQYKLSFAPEGAVPFRVGKRVLHPPAYEALVTARHEHEAATGNPWVPREGFFPAYRA